MRARLTVVSVELIPYIGKGDSSDEFLICQPEFRCRCQPWTRKVSEGVEIEVVENSGKCPGQTNGGDSGEEVLDREWGRLGQGTR